MNTYLVNASFGLYQFDLVAIRILYKGNNGGAVLHGTSLAPSLAPFAFELGAGGVGVLDLNGTMTRTLAEAVGAWVPVMGELDDRPFTFLLITCKCQGETAVRIIILAQQAHAKHLGVEIAGTLQIANTNHCMQNTHRDYSSDKKLGTQEG